MGARFALRRTGLEFPKMTTAPSRQTSTTVPARAASGGTSAPKTSFKQQMLLVREDAIVRAVNRLLAEKGFDLMTVDQVAAEVGIAKASLYKHFPSKEDLAAAAMVRVVARAQEFIAGRPADARPVEQLKALVRWMLGLQIEGEMPSLPHHNSSLRAALMKNKAYIDGLMQVSDHIGLWIEQAQQDGSLDPKNPPLLVLYTLYARACDPVLEFLTASGLYSNEEMVEMMVNTCFGGLNAR